LCDTLIGLGNSKAKTGFLAEVVYSFKYKINLSVLDLTTLIEDLRHIVSSILRPEQLERSMIGKIVVHMIICPDHEPVAHAFWHDTGHFLPTFFFLQYLFIRVGVLVIKSQLRLG